MSGRILRLSILAVSAALSVALIYILRVPMFLPFLEYDPGDIPIYICAMLLGPAEGLLLACVASVVQGLTVSAAAGWIGILMHIFATGTVAVVIGFICRKKALSPGRLTLAAVAGILVHTAMMVGWNLVFTPLYTGQPVEAVIDMIPAIIAFNIIKSSINTTMSVILCLVLKRVLGHSGTGVGQLFR